MQRVELGVQKTQNAMTRFEGMFKIIPARRLIITNAANTHMRGSDMPVGISVLCGHATRNILGS